MPGMSEIYNHKAIPQPPRISAFISYSHKDKEYLQELQDHLAYYIRNWNLKVWDDTKLQPGANRREEIDKALQFTKIAILLVSPDFFASEHIAEHELHVLLAAAREEGVIILCVVLRACAFEVSELAQFQSVNAPSNPLIAMTPAQRDEIWREVVESLWRTLGQDKEETIANPTPKTDTTGSRRLSSLNDTSSPSIISRKSYDRSRQQVTASIEPPCDICITCTIEEEVEMFMHEATRLCHATFQSIPGPHTKREYRYTMIHNNRGEPLTLYVTWPPTYGPEETALHFKSALDELKPRFAVMTGICAGDKTKVMLGDIIVAERAFRYDTGKVVLGKRGRKTQQYDTRTQNLDPNILHFVRLFDGWKLALTDLKRPISKHQQRDWLLSTLLKTTTLCVDNVPLEELEHHAPYWKKIVYELQNSTLRYLNDERILCDPARVRNLYFGKGDFPFQDPAKPRRYIAAMASGGIVRGDNPFEEICIPVRGTIAVDMEGATFYRTVADFQGLRSLLVKGVCDYADADKDDSYHEYAAAVSAVYVLSLIKEYANNDWMFSKAF